MRSARATAVRCISPPRVRGRCLIRCERPTRSSNSLARARHFDRDFHQPAVVADVGGHEDVIERVEFGEQVVELEQPKVRLQETRSPAGRLSMRLPSRLIVPESSASSVPSRCRSVLFPEPAPTMLRELAGPHLQVQSVEHANLNGVPWRRS